MLHSLDHLDTANHKYSVLTSWLRDTNKLRYNSWAAFTPRQS
jgi:hypothetical protein